MTILFVTWNFPPCIGGAERLAAELLEALRSRHQVTVLTRRGGAAGERGVSLVHRAPLPGIVGFLLWLIWRLPRHVLLAPPDAIVAFGAGAGLLCWPWARLADLPEAVVVLGTDVAHRNRLYRALLRPALRGAARVVAISGSAAAAAIAAGARSERLAILPPGIDPRFAEGTAGGSLPRPTRPLLLFVGRVVARKGLLPFVEHCLPRVLAERDVELWVLGDDATESLTHSTGELARVRDAVQARELAGCVRFLGKADDAALRAAYRRASLLVLPAIEVAGDLEGFGLVVLEAALFGVPTVATRLGGIVDAVVDGETGLLAAPGDWPEVAAAILSLLEDDALRGRLGRQARERAEGELCWARVGPRWSEALERMVHGGQSAHDA